LKQIGIVSLCNQSTNFHTLMTAKEMV